METKHPSVILPYCIQLALTRDGIGFQVEDVFADFFAILFGVVLPPIRGGVHVDGPQPPRGAVVPQHAV